MREQSIQVKITGISQRLLKINAAPRFGNEGVPQGRPKFWHYPLITIHTDNEVDGYTMGYGNHGDGRAIMHLVKDIFWKEIKGESRF